MRLRSVWQAIARFLVWMMLLSAPFSTRTALAEFVTVEKAISVIDGWLKTDRIPLQTALGQQVKQVETFRDATGVVLYYVVKLAPSGFVIVAGDDRIEPIIGFSSDENYDPSTDNPLHALVTSDLTGRLKLVKATLASPLVPAGGSSAKGKWVRLENFNENGDIGTLGLPVISDMRIAPLTQTLWWQTTAAGSACYNYYTPPYAEGNASNYPCGCVATAMAQLMRYWQYPAVGVGTAVFSNTVDDVGVYRSLQGGNGVGGPYVWDEMILDPTVSTLAQRQAIGALCNDAGVASYMSYKASGSGTSASSARTALLDTFKYSNVRHGDKGGMQIGQGLLEMVNPCLDARSPVMLGIIEIGELNGHAIICDGYGYNMGTMYHHLNVGWGGNSTAWYNLFALDLGAYNAVRWCLYNVWTNGTGETISGRILDADAAPVSGASVTATCSTGGIYTAVSDELGIYALSCLPSMATYSIRVQKQGLYYASQVIVTSVSQNRVDSSGNRWGCDFSADTCSTFSFSEDFEAGGQTPVGWDQVLIADNAIWNVQSGGHIEQGVGHPSSAHGGMFNACLFANSTAAHTTRLISPMIDFGETRFNAKLTFWHYMEGWWGDQDELRVYYRTEMSGEWKLLAQYTDSVTTWTERIILLPEVSATFFIAFEGTAKFGYGVCIDDVLITAERLDGVVCTPSFSPPSGTSFADSLVVTMNCATASAEIRYTLDGSDPNENSLLYTTPVVISESVILKARAFVDGLESSAVATAMFNKQRTLHVDAGRSDDNGDALTWETAKRTIQSAVDSAVDGDTVLVTDGVYNLGGTLPYGFALSNRVEISKDVVVRSVNGASVTVIEGSGTNMYGQAGAMRCVYLAKGVLEGFTLRGGATHVSTNLSDSCGGGVFMPDTAVNAIVRSCHMTENIGQYGGASAYGFLTNCVLAGNTGHSGGGSYCGTLVSCVLSSNTAAFDGGGSCGSELFRSILSENVATNGGGASYGSLVDCTLIDNRALSNGGGTYYGSLTMCTVSNNSARYGAGVFDSDLTLCEVRGNAATVDGGGSYRSTLQGCLIVHNAARDDGGGTAYGVADDCVISDNFASDGGGGTFYGLQQSCRIMRNVANNGGGVCYGVISNSTLTANEATNRYGGGAFQADLMDCVLTNNNANHGGGACESTLTRCLLKENTATYDGGGAFGGVLDRCLLLSNAAGDDGGGAVNCVLNICVVDFNNANDDGGGVAWSVLRSSLLAGNWCSSVGGGAHRSTLTNCTVVCNRAGEGAGGTYWSTQMNCIVWANVLTNGTPHNYISGLFTNTCTKPLPSGAGNVNADPLFVSDAGGDYRLRVGSPCVDRGNNAYVSGSVDLAGNARIQNGTVDMGAYEGASWATASSPVPVPYTWLDLYPSLLSGAGYNMEAAAMADPDGDGMTSWQEYVAGTVPTNAASVLLAIFRRKEGESHIHWTPDLTGAIPSRVYSVYGAETLSFTPPIIALTNIPAGKSVPVQSLAPCRFFKIGVELQP